ncbi:MAG: CusA/CzcA family heavy metal efflux RND transporter [Bacteroidales bacterium]
MIERIIHFSIKNKFIVGLFIIGLMSWGTYSLTQLPIDAIPDITNNQVQIISIAPSLAVQEVESFITAPVEMAVANIPDIIELRSISRLGLSVVTVVFKDGIDIYWARQQLTERIREAEEVIPGGLAKIELAPVSTGLGEIFQYRLAVQKGYEKIYDPSELRTIQDWIVRREMLGTPGVADINSYGGFVKEYEISVNPERLRAMNLTLSDIFEALEKNNENTGSAYIDKNPNAYFIRGIGLVKSGADIEKIVVKTSDSGLPVLIRDIATVDFGTATRYGAFVVDTTEAVGGVVMMLKGANAHKVIDNVQERIESVQKSLPAGVKIEPYLNRSDLVGRAIGTVSKNLIEGALIVIFILVLLLGNMRAGLIVASVIPLSMLFAISLMNIFGVSGNLMSLGAIDFGLIVDGAVIIVESVVHNIFTRRKESGQDKPFTQVQMDETVFESAKRMMSSATFGQVIILIVYIPVMALVGIEGKMFRPMAQVVTFALIGAAILSLTWVPMASALFLDKKISSAPGFSARLMDKVHSWFDPAFGYALRHKMAVSSIAVILFAGSIFLFTRLGGEFIPQLEEGDLAAGVMTLQGGSLTHTVNTVKQANKILLDNFPEVKHAVCKIGAGEIPTDPTPMETGDYIITLKDKKEWTSASTREELVAKMEDKLVTLAGVKFEFQQPIQMRFNELMTGSKQDVAIKVFGDNLTTLAEQASLIESLITGIEGVQDINVEKVTGLAQIQVEYDRDRLAQYGLSVSDVNRILRAAFAGSQAGVVYDEEKRFGLVVRLEREYRQNLDDVRNLSVSLPGGGQIPFDQLASIEIKSGPAQVSREETKRRITIGFNVRGRDVQAVISEVSSAIDKSIKLPAGYYVTYGGQFQNLQAARERLSIAVPVALLLIFVLLYFTFNSVKQTLVIYSAVPMAAIGGVVALWLRGMSFSVSAGVGFIALFGVAVLNGIVLIAEFNRLEKEGISDIVDRVRKALHSRLRPVIMTAAVASLGFLPMALSTSAGAEVQKPLATVVIGGLLTSTILTLFILPVFYIFASSPRRKSFSMSNLPVLLMGLMIFFCSNSEAYSQEKRVITLEEAIKKAGSSNMMIRSSEMNLNSLRALKGTAFDPGKTEIGYEYGQMNSFTKDNSVNISQSFSFPGVYINQGRLTNAEIRTGELELAGTKLEISAQVKQVYWELSYLYSRKKLLEYQDSLYTGFSRAAGLRAKTGESNKLELATARSKSLEIRDRLQHVRADISIATRKLGTLIDQTGFLVPSDSILRRAVIISDADSLSINSNPDLAIMIQKVEVTRRERNLERSRLMPDFNIGVFSQTIQGTQDINGTPRVFGPGDRFTGIQAGISVPIWAVPYTSRSKSAAYKEKAVALEAEYFRRTLSEQCLSLLDDYRKYSGSLRYFETQAVPEADLIIEQSGKSYKAGALDYLEYILSLDRALEIKQAYLEALRGYNLTVLEIEYLTGKN